MGSLINTTNSNVSSQTTEKGNILYEFKRVTKEQLSNYRIGTYGYLL